MRVQQAIRWLGFIAVLSGVLRMGMTPSALIWGPNSDQELWFGLTACFTMAIGSLGLYLYQAAETSMLGIISALLLALANMITGCLVWQTMIGSTADPGILPLINNIAMLAGMVLFGAVSIRARRTSIAGAFLLIAVPCIGFIPFLGDYFAAIWGMAYVLMGYPVWRSRSSEERNVYGATL